jgi:hypothetical protein
MKNIVSIDIKQEIKNLRHIILIKEREEQFGIALRQFFKGVEMSLSSYQFNDFSGQSDVLVAEFNNFVDALKVELLAGLNHTKGTKKVTLLIPTHSWYQ